MNHSDAIELVDQLEKDWIKCLPVLDVFCAYLTGASEVCTMGSDPYAVGERVYQWVQKNGYNYLECLRSRDALITFLENLPDEIRTLLPSIIALYKFVPGILNKEIMQASHIIASENPVGAGRPKMFKSREQQKEVVKEILELLENCAIGEAKQRVADRYNISKRTVDTIWRNRLSDKPPSTLPDLYKDFTNLLKPTKDAQSVP